MPQNVGFAENDADVFQNPGWKWLTSLIDRDFQYGVFGDAKKPWSEVGTMSKKEGTWVPAQKKAKNYQFKKKEVCRAFFKLRR